MKFIYIYNTKSPYAVMKTMVGVIILQRVIFSFLHNMFKLLSINDHSINKI
jgi:hypothetical protein